MDKILQIYESCEPREGQLDYAKFEGFPNPFPRPNAGRLLKKQTIKMCLLEEELITEQCQKPMNNPRRAVVKKIYDEIRAQRKLFLGCADDPVPMRGYGKILSDDQDSYDFHFLHALWGQEKAAEIMEYSEQRWLGTGGSILTYVSKKNNRVYDVDMRKGLDTPIVKELLANELPTLSVEEFKKQVAPIEKSIDNGITNALYIYLTKEKRVREKDPLSYKRLDDEVKKRLQFSVENLEPVTLYVIWGCGNKKKMDYFDFYSLCKLAGLIPTCKGSPRARDTTVLAKDPLGASRPYNICPLEVEILFCDNHAIEINNKDKESVESYYNSIKTFIETNMKKFPLHIQKMSRVLSLSNEFSKGYNEMKQYICSEDDPIRYLFDFARNPAIEHLEEIVGYSNQLFELIEQDEKASKKLDKRSAKHGTATPGVATEDSEVQNRKRKYVTARCIEGAILLASNVHKRGIFVSLGDDDLEKLFITTPRIYVSGFKEKNLCPWFLDATTDDINMLTGEEKENQRALFGEAE